MLVLGGMLAVVCDLFDVPCFVVVEVVLTVVLLVVCAFVEG